MRKDGKSENNKYLYLIKSIFGNTKLCNTKYGGEIKVRSSYNVIKAIIYEQVKINTKSKVSTY